MKIGLTQRVIYHKQRAYDSIDHNWYTYLNHTPFLIPNIINQDFKSLAESLDLLIITGGDDSSVRRITELRLSTEMMKLQKPIVGICHGAFLLTDVLGGTISEIDGHSDTEHDVNYFKSIIPVNSYHSLSIKKTHNSAKILCTDSDGYCEAWIDNNIAGVVWHPERMTIPWVPDEIKELMK